MNTTPKVSKEKAIQWKNELIALCKKHGVWFDVIESSTPELKQITVSASMKVTEK